MDYHPPPNSSGDRHHSSDSAYFSNDNASSDPSRHKPTGPSKQLSTLEKIMGRASMNIAEAKSKCACENEKARESERERASHLVTSAYRGRV